MANIEINEQGIHTAEKLERDWLPVESSNLAAVRYRNGHLDVRFKHGGIYRYSNVPPATVRELLVADSIGSCFHKLIKQGGFTFERLD